MTNTLIERRARIVVTVRRDDDAGVTTESEYVFTEHRASIQVAQGGGLFGNAKVQLFGVAMDAMNNIARLWLEVLSPGNSDRLRIEVWDGANFVPFFEGVITWTAINASGAPDVALEIEANDAMAAMNIPAAPYAQDTPIGLRDALTAILAPAALVVEVAESIPELMIQRVHLMGTPMEQANTLMSYFPELTYYTNLSRFIVRPVNAPIGGEPLVVSRDTGLIGYPTYATSGISFSMVFDPRVRLGLALDLQTEFDFVNRTRWLAAVLQHHIQPNWPGGQWITQVAAQSYGSKGDGAGSDS